MPNMCCLQNTSFDKQQSTWTTLFSFEPNNHKAFRPASLKMWCIIHKQALRHFCRTVNRLRWTLVTLDRTMSTEVLLRATAASNRQKRFFFLTSATCAAPNISGWSTNTSMLCYANASLPTHKKEWCGEWTATVQCDLQRRLTQETII